MGVVADDSMDASAAADEATDEYGRFRDAFVRYRVPSCRIARNKRRAKMSWRRRGLIRFLRGVDVDAFLASSLTRFVVAVKFIKSL